MRSKDKIKDKNEVKFEFQTNDKTIRPSNSKVKDIIGQFEADVIKRTDMNTKDSDVKKGDIKKNAFEALMKRDNTGDTPKRTPVRRRVKRLNKITSSNASILDWVSKTDRKGTILDKNSD